MKMISLLLLTPQYALLILTMRYVRTRPGAMFVTSTAVLLAELVKTLTCLLLVLVEQRSARLWALHLYENLLCQPWDFLKVCVPSLLFVVQNNLVFVAVSNLDAATFQVRTIPYCGINCNASVYFFYAQSTYLSQASI